MTVYYCTACERGDFPETTQFGADSTVRDHLRIWHPDQWGTLDYDFDLDRMVVSPKALSCDGSGSQVSSNLNDGDG